MKNLKVVALGIALIGNTLTFAQKEAKMSVEEKSEKISVRLTEELDLSPSQTSEVKTLNVEYITKQREIRSNTTLSKEEKKKLMQSSRKTNKVKLETILSPEQLAKLDTLRKDKKGKKKKISPTQKVEKMTSKLDEIVMLTSIQKPKIQKVNLHSVLEINRIKKDDSLSEEDRKIALKKVRKHKKKQLKSILTKEQLAKLKEAKKKVENRTSTTLDNLDIIKVANTVAFFCILILIQLRDTLQ